MSVVARGAVVPELPAAPLAGTLTAGVAAGTSSGEAMAAPATAAAAAAGGTATATAAIAAAAFSAGPDVCERQVTKGVHEIHGTRHCETCTCHIKNRRQRASRERRPRCVNCEFGGRTAGAAAFETLARVHESLFATSLAIRIMDRSVRPRTNYGSFKSLNYLTTIPFFEKRSLWE